MKRILSRSLAIFLAVLLCAGLYAGWRAGVLYRTAYGGYANLRALLDSGESISGAPANEVLSDDYLRNLFNNNEQLVTSLKSVIDTGMATDDSLQLGNVAAMVILYREDADGAVVEPAVCVVGGFPDPKSERIGLNTRGFLDSQLEPSMWTLGFSVVNMFGRDIVLFCEEDKAEMQMERIWNLLNGEILPFARDIVASPVHYTMVVPDPKQLLPPNIRKHVQSIQISGILRADDATSETLFVCNSVRAAAYVHHVVRDMADMARVVFHDRFGGYVKEMPWGKMNDQWWAVEAVRTIDESEIVQDNVLVVARNALDRRQENFALKVVERCGRDIASQKAMRLNGTRPWDFAYNQAVEGKGRYWSAEHLDGANWPLGAEGVETPGSRAEREAREKAEAEAAAKKSAENAAKEKAARQAATAG
ncbi:MAG: hypothetical protein IJS32_00960 [Kiritimatiellae bacterium]|nr:hypothetical protein [Kiritimatiellia bacterium]